MNVNKLKGKIVERGLNITKLAEAIGMDRSTFYRKMQNDGETFTIREVNNIVKALNLTPNEAMDIFFTNRVA